MSIQTLELQSDIFMKKLILIITSFVFLHSVWAESKADSVQEPGEQVIPMGTPRAWGLAADAILTEHNGMRHDMLGGWPRDGQKQKEYKAVLAKIWGINNRTDLLKILEQLEDRGTREEFQQLGKLDQALTADEYQAKLIQLGVSNYKAQQQLIFAHRWHKQLGSQSLISFDLVRVINLSRRGYLVGYLNADEAWQHIFKASKLLQKTYPSWEELAYNYTRGRIFWNDDERTHQRLYNTIVILLSDEEGPWKLNSWTLNLGTGF